MRAAANVIIFPASETVSPFRRASHVAALTMTPVATPELVTAFFSQVAHYGKQTVYTSRYLRVFTRGRLLSGYYTPTKLSSSFQD